jgi:hypothetical protein
MASPLGRITPLAQPKQRMGEPGGRQGGRGNDMGPGDQQSALVDIAVVAETDDTMLAFAPSGPPPTACRSRSAASSLSASSRGCSSTAASPMPISTTRCVQR